MDGLDKVPMTVSLAAICSLHMLTPAQREIYVKRIIPIGILFSGSLILSNSAYLT